MQKCRRYISYFCLFLFMFQLFLGGFYSNKAYADTAFIFDESFNSLSVGSVPAGWSLWTPAVTKSGAIVDLRPGGLQDDNCLKLYSEGVEPTDPNDAVSISKVIPDQTSTFTVEFEYQVPDSSTKALYFEIGDNSIAGYGAKFGMGKTNIYVSGTSIATGLTAGSWYSVKVIVNPVDKNYQVYLNNELITATPIPYQNTNHSKISRFAFSNDYNIKTAGIGYIDNVKVYPGILPFVTSSTPVNNAVDVSVRIKQITLLFNTSMDIGTLNNANITIVKGTSNEDVSYSVYSSTSDSYTITLPDILDISTQYKVIINTNVKTSEGRAFLSPEIITFTTSNSSVNLKPFVNIKKPLSGTSYEVGANATIEAEAYDQDGSLTRIEFYNNGMLLPQEGVVHVSGNMYIYNFSSLQKGTYVISVMAYDDNNETSISNPVTIYVGKDNYLNHSDVLISSRWYRNDSSSEPIGTLDVMKRFMATEDKWSYITDQTQIHNISNLGIGFQGALSPANGDQTKGRAVLFDGTLAQAPWMTWGAKWGCVNNPDFAIDFKNQAHVYIDAGARAIQIDGWLLNKSIGIWGTGCFCDHCMAEFKSYLAENYTANELAGWGISDINSFNYMQYLKDIYNISTNAEYISMKQQLPLNDAFENFQIYSTRKFLIDFKNDLQVYAGNKVELSANAPLLTNITPQNNFALDIFDYFIGETDESSFEIQNAVSRGAFIEGTGKSFIISPLPFHKDKVRQGISTAYALGYYMLVPWDTWLYGSTRYYGSVEDYGDLYHFIRQNSQLFDGYETAAKVGILAKWDEVDMIELEDLSMKLFNAGIPFRDLIVSNSNPILNIDAHKLEGLNYIISQTPISSLNEADRQLISQSGITVIAPEEVISMWLDQQKAVGISGLADVYTSVRAKIGDNDASKIIHILNQDGRELENVQLEINNTDFFGTSDVNAVIYSPGKNPQILTVTQLSDGKSRIDIPSIGIWGVIKVSKSGLTTADKFTIPVPWSGINIGNPSNNGEGLYNEGSFTIKSNGKGLNINASGDSGSQDQIAYVYQQVDSTPLQDYSISSRIVSVDGADNGAMSGIMIRESSASNSRFVAIGYENGNGLKMEWRDEFNQTVGQTNLGEIQLPVYLKLEKHGSCYSAYISQDGINWGAELARHNISLNNMLSGMFTASNSSSVQNIAVFDDVVLSYGDTRLPQGEIAGLNITVSPKIEIGRYAHIQATAIINDGTSLDVTEESINYSSSNPDIAAVDKNGIIKGLARGTTLITADLSIGGVHVTNSVSVEVVMPDPYLVNESFENFDIDNLPDGWTLFDNNENGAYIIVDDVPSTSDKSIKIFSGNSQSPRMNKSFEVQTIPVTVEMDFKIKYGPDISKTGALACYLLDSSGAMAVSILADPANGFWYLDGSTATPIAPVVEDQWYHLKVIANPITNKMDIYIDGELKVNQGNFRNNTNNLKQLSFGSSTTSLSTTINWNNIKVSSSAKDQTPPVITVNMPVSTEYSDSDDLTPQFTVTDNGSGVDAAKTEAMLDNQSISLGTTVPLYTLPLGTHVYTVKAWDMAGNTTTVSVNFRTTTSIDALKTLVAKFENNEWIDNGGIANSLQKKLEHENFNAFINEVQAQSGKHITAEAAGYLVRDAQVLSGD